MFNAVSESAPRSGFAQMLRVALGALVAVLLFSMMLLTFVDVIGRYFFNSPVAGSYEITEVLLALTVFAALPLATLREEHVTVAIFERFFQGGLRIVQQLLVGALSTVALGGMAWRLWDQAGTLAEYDDRSLYLQIPLAYVAYFMTVMAAVSALVVVALTFSEFRKSRQASRGAGK